MLFEHFNGSRAFGASGELGPCSNSDFMYCMSGTCFNLMC